MAYHANTSWMREQYVKKEIKNGGPVQGSMTVYYDFYQYQSGIYHHVSGAYEGGHAIKIIGWGRKGFTKYWIAANSWGTNWGEEGYFKIRMDQEFAYEVGTCQPDL